MISSLHFTKPQPRALGVWLGSTAAAVLAIAGAQTATQLPQSPLPGELEGCKIGHYWGFENGHGGWKQGHRVAPPEVSDGRLIVRNVGEDPQVVGPAIELPASEYQFLGMRVRTNREGLTQVFYNRRGDTGFTEKRMIPVAMNGDGRWHTYPIDLRSIKDWNGTITGLRVDPVNGLTEIGATTEIDWIAVYQTPPQMEALLPYWKGDQRLVIGFKNRGGQDARQALQLCVDGNVVGDIGRLESPGSASVEIDARGLPDKFWLEATLGPTRIWRGRMCKPIEPPAVSSTLDAEEPGARPRILVGSGAGLLTLGSSARSVKLAPIASLTIAGPGKETTYYEFDVEPRQPTEMPLDPSRWFQEHLEDPLVGTLACTTTVDGTTVRTALESTVPLQVLRFEGPRMLHARAPSHAIFPGVEYLEAGEESSSADWTGPAEADRTTPDRTKITVPLMAIEYDRAAPPSVRGRAVEASAMVREPAAEDASERSEKQEPEGAWVAGLAWDIDNRRQLSPGPPTAEFVSRAQGLSYATVFLPSMPEVQENQRYASKAYALAADQHLQLETRFVLEQGTIEEVFEREWIDAAPKPPGLDWAAEDERVPLADRAGAGSRAAIERILEISMLAYTKTLFSPTAPGWKTHIAIGEAYGYRNLVAATVLAESLRAQRPEYAEAVRLPPSSQVEELAGHVGALIGAEARAAADEVLAKLDAQGGIVYVQTPEMTEKIEDFTKFYGITYADLGRQGQTNSGLTALHVEPLLEYAACTLEPKYVAAALRAVERVNSFTVPRGAQTWEIHMHTPDLYGSAQAVLANLWGYRITGNQRFLDQATRWARTGLPFIYMWQPPDGEHVLFVQVADKEGEGPEIAQRDPGLFYADVRREINPYASIPVFGTSWFAVTWFGIPVQWCGLAWGNAIRELDAYRPMPHLVEIADGLFRSAANQQCDSGYLAGTLPDSWEVDGARSRQPFIIPDRILEYAYRVLDEPYLDTLRYERIDSPRWTHVASRALLGAPRMEGKSLAVTARFYADQAASVLIGGRRPPSEVRVNGRKLEGGQGTGQMEWIPCGERRGALLVRWVASGSDDTIEVLD